jgi:(2Fe-2S) ferredoxin
MHEKGGRPRMSGFTKEKLEAYRNELKSKESGSGKGSGKRGKIAISLGTCGIAAGGDKVYEIIKKELEAKHISDIELTVTGCLGLCFCEPNLMISVDGMPDVLYGYITPKIASRIVDEHVQKGYLIGDNVIFMPAKDLCEKLSK